MSKQQEDPGHSIKRITLPSGKTIEVVHFYDAPEAAPEAIEESGAGAPVEEQALLEPPKEDAPPAAEPVRELHVCPACRANLVYPTRWHEADAEHWHVTLRCPSCEWTESGVFSQDVADRFDEELERGTEALVRDLKRLTRANMAEEIDRFVVALDADAILPMDF